MRKSLFLPHNPHPASHNAQPAHVHVPENLRRARHRRGPRRHRGRAGRGAHGGADRHPDPEPRHHRANVVQPGHRRVGEGAHGPRDRRARRRDGSERRRHRHPMPDAQRVQGAERARAAFPVRQEGVPVPAQGGVRGPGEPRPATGQRGAAAGQRRRPRGRRGNDAGCAAARAVGGHHDGDVHARAAARRIAKPGGRTDGRSALGPER